jgi:leader peptidase (prepilin peptidase)/N-methyltransferase
VVVPEWIWLVFTFVFGCCVGSFLNVVIYRLPLDRSLIIPPSACPACGKRIAFYDNIPLVSWLLLGAKCRYCKASISLRYFVIEFLTGLVFTILFVLYFRTGLRAGVGSFPDGGWFIYLISVILLSALIAASAIDMELWVIPITICWFITATGLLGSAIGVYIIKPALIRQYFLLPSASSQTGSLAAGATTGLVISLILLATGFIKRSYETEDRRQKSEVRSQKSEARGQKSEARGQKSEVRSQKSEVGSQKSEVGSQKSEVGSKPEFNHRREMCKEILFLLPIIICSLVAFWIFRKIAPVHSWWVSFSQHPVIAGLLGSLWGYFVGCGIVWATRILGTLGFGKEAMGLGDVHLMGAAGAVIGPAFVVVAFFIAPFFGLLWTGFQMFFKKIRQIPYGPFLSLGICKCSMLKGDTKCELLKQSFC